MSDKYIVIMLLLHNEKCSGKLSYHILQHFKRKMSIVYPEYKLSQTLLVKISFFSKIKIHIDISIQFMKIDFLIT